MKQCGNRSTYASDQLHARNSNETSDSRRFATVQQLSERPLESEELADDSATRTLQTHRQADRWVDGARTDDPVLKPTGSRRRMNGMQPGLHSNHLSSNLLTDRRRSKQEKWPTLILDDKQICMYLNGGRSWAVSASPHGPPARRI
jgi:hypothetical protein